jgi:hypothetical protein
MTERNEVTMAARMKQFRAELAELWRSEPVFIESLSYGRLRMMTDDELLVMVAVNAGKMLRNMRGDLIRESLRAAGHAVQDAPTQFNHFTKGQIMPVKRAITAALQELFSNHAERFSENPTPDRFGALQTSMYALQCAKNRNDDDLVALLGALPITKWEAALEAELKK